MQCAPCVKYNSLTALGHFKPAQPPLPGRDFFRLNADDGTTAVCTGFVLFRALILLRCILTVSTGRRVSWPRGNHRKVEGVKKQWLVTTNKRSLHGMDAMTCVNMCGIRSWSSSPVVTLPGDGSCARTQSSPRNSTSDRQDTRTCPSSRTCNRVRKHELVTVNVRRRPIVFIFPRISVQTFTNDHVQRSRTNLTFTHTTTVRYVVDGFKGNIKRLQHHCMFSCIAAPVKISIKI